MGFTGKKLPSYFWWTPSDKLPQNSLRSGQHDLPLFLITSRRTQPFTISDAGVPGNQKDPIFDSGVSPGHIWFYSLRIILTFNFVPKGWHIAVSCWSLPSASQTCQLISWPAHTWKFYREHLCRIQHFSFPCFRFTCPSNVELFCRIAFLVSKQNKMQRVASSGHAICCSR